MQVGYAIKSTCELLRERNGYQRAEAEGVHGAPLLPVAVAVAAGRGAEGRRGATGAG
jgi:hypothetical protein